MPLYDKNGKLIGAPTSAATNGTTTDRAHLSPPVSQVQAPIPAPAAQTIRVPIQNTPAPAPAHAPVAPPVSYAPPAPAQAQAQAPVVSGIGDPRAPIFSVPPLPIDDLLRTMLGVGEGVSDLFFMVGRPPQVENFGKLTAVDGTKFSPAFTAQQTEGLAHTLVGTSQRLLDDLRNSGSCDCSYFVEGLARFRVNVFKQRGTFAMVLRKLNTKIPTMDDLKLAPVFKKIIAEKNGLVFVTGATGSGKTTTLAAMLNGLNEEHAMHIVTLEDPVEFMHPHKAATFCQREMGKDFSSFALGLRAALRQAPKVILVGEIRDRETMEIALTAAETGHTVFSTLHTISATQSINRVLGMFSKEEESQVRERLAETLRWVVSQRLAPKIGGGRVMIPEIMGSNMRSREAIQLGENDVRSLHDIITQSKPEGWVTFEGSLCEAYAEKKITEETAMLLAVNKTKMRQALDRLKKTLGQDDQGPHSFKLAPEDEHLKKPGHTPAPAAAAVATPAPAPAVSAAVPLRADALATVPANLKLAK